MRLLLAALVMLSHGSFLMPSIDTLIPRGLVYGPVAVFVFFVISGFIITEAVLNFYDGRPVRFFLNRLLRLYPPYLTALAVACVVLFAVPKLQFPELSPEWTNRENLFANLFSIFPTVFLTDQILGVKHRIDFISINWALRVEFAFYMVVALVIFFSRYLRRIGVSKSAGLRFVFLIFLCIHIYYFYVSGSNSRGTFYSSFIPYFLLGVAWALWLNSPKPNHWHKLFFVSFFLSILQAAIYPEFNVGRNDGTSTLKMINLAPAALWVILICVFVALSHLRLTVSCVRKFDSWAGDLSYTVYLMHIPALYIIVNEPWFEGYFQLLNYVLLTLLLAWICELLCSRLFNPMRNIFRGTVL